MSQPSSSSSFQALLGAALKDYENRTGISLVNHPVAKQLEDCHSLDSINVILQEQAKGFCEFRGDKGKLMKSLKCSIDVLYTISTVLGEGFSVPFPPAKAIFTGIAVLLAAVKNRRASYDTLVELFASFENFLSRLSIYTGIPPTLVLTDVLVKIIAELLYSLALVTKHDARNVFISFIDARRNIGRLLQSSHSRVYLPDNTPFMKRIVELESRTRTRVLGLKGRSREWVSRVPARSATDPNGLFLNTDKWR